MSNILEILASVMLVTSTLAVCSALIFFQICGLINEVDLSKREAKLSWVRVMKKRIIKFKQFKKENPEQFDKFLDAAKKYVNNEKITDEALDLQVHTIFSGEKKKMVKDFVSFLEKL